LRNLDHTACGEKPRQALEGAQSGKQNGSTVHDSLLLAAQTTALFAAIFFHVSANVRQDCILVSRGDPLDIRSEVKYVFIEGKLVDLNSRNTDLYDKFHAVAVAARRPSTASGSP